MMADETTSDVQPADVAEPVAEEQTPDFDPYRVPLDELTAKIAESVMPDEDVDPPPIPEHPEEIEATEETDGDEEEHAEEETPEADTEETEAPVETKADLDVELLLAKQEANESRMKALESNLGRQAGLAGHLKKENERLKQELAQARRQQSSAQDEYEPVQEASYAPVQATVEPAGQAYLSKIASLQGAQQFVMAHPEAMQNGVLDTDLQKVALESQAEITNFIRSNDPDDIEAGTRAFMEAAWAKVEAGRKAERVAELERKRASQSDELKQKKRASTASSTGAKVSPKKKPIDPMKLPMEELEKRIREGRFT